MKSSISFRETAMRFCILALSALLTAALPVHAQRFGGFGGGQGGPQAGGGGGPPRDPGQFFDFISRGKGFIVINEMKSTTMRESFAKYAQSKGINDGKLTREHFSAAMTEYSKNNGGMFMRKGPPGSEGSSAPSGGPPTGVGSAPTSAPNSEEAMTKLAEAEFRGFDRNGDGKLNADEMPARLRENMDRYDVNKDGLIDAAEFRGYMASRMDRREEGAKQQSNPVVILVEEELETRPTVYRVGKMPKELPKWFTDLDTDGDGQIALFEWRVSKSMDEFAEYDRNDDGFITPEEVLRKMGLTGTAVANSTGSPSAPTIIRGQDGDQRRGPQGGGGGGGGGMWQGFGGFRKKGNN